MVEIIISETLCWTCSRAYAKTGEKGCEFHRSGEKVYKEAEVFTTSGYTRVLVTVCDNYDLSKRALKDLKANKKKNVAKFLLTYSEHNKELQNVL